MRWFLAVLGCLHLGCVIQSEAADAPLNSHDIGDITFLWSFDGKPCSQVPQVRSIHAAIAGAYGSKVLDTGYACSGEGVDGVKLSFLTGDYTFTLDALDANGQVLYSATGSASVQSGMDVRVPVTLHSVSQRGLVRVSWSFGTDQHPCAQAGIAGPEGISEVSVRIDGQGAKAFPCADVSSGAPVEGGAISLDEGTHLLQLDGIIERGGERQTWYSASRSVTMDAEAIASGKAASVSVNLEVVAAQATFAPVADAQGGAFSCSASGAGVLFIRVTDPNSPSRCFPLEAVTGGCGRYSDCATAAEQGFHIDYLPVGQTHDGDGGRWRAAWNAEILAFKQLPAGPTSLYQGSLSAAVEAATDLSYSVPMAKQP